MTIGNTFCSEDISNYLSNILSDNIIVELYFASNIGIKLNRKYR